MSDTTQTQHPQALRYRDTPYPEVLVHQVVHAIEQAYSQCLTDDRYEDDATYEALAAITAVRAYDLAQRPGDGSILGLGHEWAHRNNNEQPKTLNNCITRTAERQVR